MDREILKNIIEDGTYAISGDNSQPWRFEVFRNELFIYCLSYKDNPVLNVRKRGSYIAHGSLIENITISAGSRGYATAVTLFPKGELSDITARIVFTPASPIYDPLFDCIRKRTSNRRPYDAKRFLTKEQKEYLQSATKDMQEGKILFVEDKEIKQKVGQAMSVTEEVALTIQSLHYYFFKDIVWTEKEERQKKTGLYIRALELPLPAILLFRVIKYWPIMKFFNTLGFYKLAALGNAQKYSLCSAFGAISVQNSDRSFLIAGRITQRIWLMATHLGLAMQVVTGIPFLFQKLNEQEKFFKPWQTLRIRSAYQALQTIFGTNNGIIAMLFRIGYAPAPSASSSRLRPDIIFHDAI